ncbi:MAG TPA: HlyD family efflux transporter periplasmic adaptor subunit [Burkholderiales bacterium]|nr:HlyD family efflux transporter periplasmic adaptor subunit [Burkholderiales bacterium]
MKRFHAIVLVTAITGCGDQTNGALQGYAEGEYLRVASPIAGQLARLHVARGTEVKTGEPLFALEQENETAARRQAEEQLRQADAQYRNLLTGKRPEEIEALRAQLAQAEASLTLSESNLRRQEELVSAKFVSKEAADTARSARDRDQGRVSELKAQLAAAKLAARPDEIRAAQAAAAAAREALAQAEWRLEQKNLRAPREGQVTDTLYVQGEWVPAGSPVVALLPPANIKVRFFVPEKVLGSVKIGQAVSVRCDGCEKPISALISYISPQAEYTPPVIYSRENRTKLVFLVEARPAPAEAAKLHPGQPVEVTFP